MYFVEFRNNTSAHRFGTELKLYSVLGLSYDRDLDSFVYKNFELKIYEKFHKNVIGCLSED